VRDGPQVRFYAGAPIQSGPGLNLGCLCVLDSKPRSLTPDQVALLATFARQIGRQLDLRRMAESLRRQSRLLEKTERIAHIGGWEFEFQTKKLSWTAETYRIHGLEPDAGAPTLESAIDWYAPGSRAIIRDAVEAASSRGTPFDLELQIIPAHGRPCWVRSTGQREDVEGQPYRLFGTFQDVSELRQLETELLVIAQREQATIGTSIHEGLSQDLTGLALLLKDVAARAPVDDVDLMRDFEQLQSLVHAAIGTCCDLVGGLAPTGPERGGLVAALQSLADRTFDLHGVKVSLEACGEDSSTEPMVAEHVYRIVQSAVDNMLKNSRPRNIAVTIDITTKNTAITVTDDGNNVPQDAVVDSRELELIRYRARRIGASLSVERLARIGTKLVCNIPSEGINLTRRSTAHSAPGQARKSC
jgi:signal transduction histidine kinase